MGPSSTLVIELSDKGQKTNPLVRVFINDNLVETNQCGNKNACNMSEFINALQNGGTYFTIKDDISAECAK